MILGFIFTPSSHRSFFFLSVRVCVCVCVCVKDKKKNLSLVSLHPYVQCSWKTKKKVIIDYSLYSHLFYGSHHLRIFVYVFFFCRPSSFFFTNTPCNIFPYFSCVCLSVLFLFFSGAGKKISFVFFFLFIIILFFFKLNVIRFDLKEFFFPR